MEAPRATGAVMRHVDRNNRSEAETAPPRSEAETAPPQLWGDGVPAVAWREAVSASSLFFFVLLTLTACDPPFKLQSAHAEQPTPSTSPTARIDSHSEAADHDSPDRITADEFPDRYPWSSPEADWPGAADLANYVQPPAGYRRVDLEQGTWGDFLRHLPIRLDRTSVRAHDGRPVGSPSAGVVLLPVGEENLQQCADSILRLRAEYLWSVGQRDRIAFHFTSGDVSAWSKWRRGERFAVDGSSVERRWRGRASGSRSNFRAYLRHLFRYAGTHSLPMDSERVESERPLRPGDFFVESGSPGHAVLLLDVAENDDGDRVGLFGQGFMPAQEFHLVRSGRALGGRSVWFELPEDASEKLKTPSWAAFERRQARRFP